MKIYDFNGKKTLVVSVSGKLELNYTGRKKHWLFA